MALDGYSLRTIPAFVGRTLGVTEWVAIDQERIGRFADCTDDHQWIHVDVERAGREGSFGSTVAHGYLTLALLARFTYEVGLVPADAGQAFNYGLDRVRFMTPVRAGARIRDRVTLLAAEEKGPGRLLVKAQHTIEIEGEDKPAMVAEALAILVAERVGARSGDR
jgi:acyl dehydratase